MKRREVELFNISFLDILAGALGAVLFLFIVVPKGEGKGPAAHPQLFLTLDTVQNKFFGDLPDSLRESAASDTLLSIVFNYERMPSLKNCPEPKPCPKAPDTREMKRYIARLEAELSRYKISSAKSRQNSKAHASQKRSTRSVAVNRDKSTIKNKYSGDLPNVPCKFSVEIRWPDIQDNVDLFLCKDGSCVYGGRRRSKTIGFWDSGKSKTNIFGGDLRTTQEAVRQFDAIIPGDYTVYAQYKGATNEPKQGITISGLVYTKTQENGEHSKTFTKTLSFNKKERSKIGEISLNADGSFTFIQF